MESFLEKFNQNEYFNKSDKYYLFDDYQKLIIWIKNDVVIDPQNIIQLLPLERASISEKDNNSELALVIKKYISENQNFFSSKRAQWHLFLQKECLPQLIYQNKSFLEKLIRFDFSKDFKYVIKNISYECTNGLSLSLKFLDSNYFKTQTPIFKKKIVEQISEKLLNEDLVWSSIPNFIKNEAKFLIHISYFAATILKVNEFKEYQNFIVRGKFNKDLNFLSQLKDDGYLALLLAHNELKKSYKFWLIVAKQYESYEREETLHQYDYMNFYWEFVPQDVKCNKFYKKNLKRTLPNFNIPE
jgi:hypothetical protein